MRWVSLPELPESIGKYFVKTITPMGNVNGFMTYFNGSKFDVNNQIVTHWLHE